MTTSSAATGASTATVPSPITPRWLAGRVTRWYATNARELPWRAADASAWAVLVSEFMLQQTPVARVLPAWREWLRRWPTAPALAAEEPAEAIRAWGRLGYPRRALRLHAAARAIDADHDGQVPATEEALRALPGVGAYTAAAVVAFAYRRRAVVLDTNVRRVLGRAVAAESHPSQAVGRAERSRADALLPADGTAAARLSVGLMELGALVCTSAAPRCSACPLRDRCRWHLSGRPATERRRRRQSYQGTDRQARGRLLAVLREHTGPVPVHALEAAWPAAAQRDRALAGLVADGLTVRAADGRYRLP